jgi:hypothetical protein
LVSAASPACHTAAGRRGHQAAENGPEAVLLEMSCLTWPGSRV